MNLKVSVDKNWGIGKDNKLLISLKEDMNFFREKTKGTVVIMGQNTLRSFPNGKPLKNRDNIVLSLDKNYVNDEVVVARSIPEAIKKAKEYNKEIFVIGGASIYKQMLKFCDVAYITKIDRTFDADTFFPNLDELFNWSVKSQTEEKQDGDISYKFVTYVNSQVSLDFDETK